MKKALVVLMALALVVIFATTQTVYAQSSLIPAIKVAGGWTSVVSYINEQAPPAGGQVFVHATYQVKNMANLGDACRHLDGRSETTLDDLTTTVLTATGGGVGTVFPAADTVGSAIIEPPVVAGTPTAEGFLVLENYDSAGALGADGTLTAEAIIFNLSSGFLYSQRALSVTQVAASTNTRIEVVGLPAPIDAQANVLEATPRSAGAATVLNNTAAAGTMARFAFLPPAIATTGAYVIAINRVGTAELADGGNSVNLVATGYNAAIRLEARRSAQHANNPGVHNRLEDFRSLTQANTLTCIGQLSPAQLTGNEVPAFITNGGWMNLAPRCWETEAPGAFQVCDVDGAGTEVGDSAIIYKVEFASAYGFAVTPQHPQWFNK